MGDFDKLLESLAAVGKIAASVEFAAKQRSSARKIVYVGNWAGFVRQGVEEIARQPTQYACAVIEVEALGVAVCKLAEFTRAEPTVRLEPALAETIGEIASFSAWNPEPRGDPFPIPLPPRPRPARR